MLFKSGYAISDVFEFSVLSRSLSAAQVEGLGLVIRAGMVSELNLRAVLQYP